MNLRKIIAFASGLLVLALLAMTPLDVAAQGKGHGNGHGNGYRKPGNRNPGNRDRRDERKSRKFVNGHDARDGKWRNRNHGNGNGNGRGNGNRWKHRRGHQ